VESLLSEGVTPRAADERSATAESIQSLKQARVMKSHALQKLIETPVSTDAAVAWPSHCCVPAFLLRALSEFASDSALGSDNELRRSVAHALGTTVPPNDANPWSLNVSQEPALWGTTVVKAMASFDLVRALVPGCENAVLNHLPVSEVCFELYEEAVMKLTESGAIVAMTFDFTALRTAMGSQVRDRAPHLTRITPLGEDRHRTPNILSSEFDFDYDGSIWVYDDSMQMSPEPLLLPWRSLIHASHVVHGGFWAVQPAGTG
jgi:hypothetical protein